MNRTPVAKTIVVVVLWVALTLSTALLYHPAVAVLVGLLYLPAIALIETFVEQACRKIVA